MAEAANFPERSIEYHYHQKIVYPEGNLAIEHSGLHVD